MKDTRSETDCTAAGTAGIANRVPKEASNHSIFRSQSNIFRPVEQHEAEKTRFYIYQRFHTTFGFFKASSVSEPNKNPVRKDGAAYRREPARPAMKL